MAEDDGRNHPAAATPGVVPAGPKRDRGAPSAENGPRASAADTEPGERQETNGGHTWRTSATCPALAGDRRTLPRSAAAAPPPQPRATSTLRSNVAAAAPPAGATSGCGSSPRPLSRLALPGAAVRSSHPAGRNFREQQLRKACPAGGKDSAVLCEEAPNVRMHPLGGGSRGSRAGRLRQGRAVIARTPRSTPVRRQQLLATVPTLAKRAKTGLQGPIQFVARLS